MSDLSAIAIVYLPAFSVLTFALPFLSVIVKPGPTVPVSFCVAIVDALEASASPATAAVSRIATLRM